jgi:hypothetical protein
MHQQIRTSLGKSGLRDGTGAKASVPIEIDPLEMAHGALVELLDLLASKGYNLEMAHGHGIEAGGEFIFAVEHEDQTLECAQMLADAGYRKVRVVEVHLCRVAHNKGTLAECIRELTDQGRKIDEIYVGVQDADGLVPVQITTIRHAPGSQAG